MTRELDWRIHEYMGNDLTRSGWEWLDDESNTIILRLYDLSGEQAGFELQSITHYSSTWEGAGLVMKCSEKNCEMNKPSENKADRPSIRPQYLAKRQPNKGGITP